MWTRCAGGAGDDTYYVSTGDTVTERANEGIDVVYAGVSWTLGRNLEHLTLTGSADIDATGNGLANVLTGNSGNNWLDGKGGADTMAGGAGDDTYVVAQTADVVIESAGAGLDTVRSSVGYTLGEHLEHLTLTGTKAIHGTGNALANVLTGNNAHNKLTGGAGDDRLAGLAGADTLVGGLGNDTYLLGLGDGADTIVENDSTLGNSDSATVSRRGRERSDLVAPRRQQPRSEHHRNIRCIRPARLVPRRGLPGRALPDHRRRQNAARSERPGAGRRHGRLRPARTRHHHAAPRLPDRPQPG